MSRRRTALALTVAAVAIASTATAHAAPGDGTVTDTLTATVTTGGLTLAGAGANVALNAVPGSFTPTTGATVLTMTDTTGTSNGWTVTAAYSAPTAPNVLDLGGASVKVSSFNAVPDTALAPLLGTGGLNTVTNQALTTPVAVLNTAAATGLGISTAQVGYQVKVPVTATVGQVYGGKVTYTIASVR